MSATTDEIVRVLGRTIHPMTGSEIYAAGQFVDNALMMVALHDMSTKSKTPQIERVKPADGGKFQYKLIASGAAPKVAPPVAQPAQVAEPKVQRKTTKPPANDGAYAAVLYDLKRRRDDLTGEIGKLDAAIVAVEALA